VEILVTVNPELEDVVRGVREKLDNPNIKNSEEDFDDEEDLNLSTSNSNPNIIKKMNAVKAGEENQVISEPNNNKSRVARTLIFKLKISKFSPHAICCYWAQK